MEALIIDWLSLLVRWLHLITGIAWIGASFYFVWLDNSLQTPPDWKKEKGIGGDLWAFHGGGIYEVAKYVSSPKVMPAHLHWFKWEAYSTFITGSLLLIIVYYLRADLYLVGNNTIINTPIKSILASLIFLTCGVLSYEVLVRKLAANKGLLFIGCLVCIIVFACWVATEIFSARAAFLHVGALMASIMVSNVFFGIIPAQKRFVIAIEKNEKINTTEMGFAKLRSVHNNYFTLPVLFCMISNHYSFLYGHPYNWQILVFIIAVTAYARHFFNLRHKGIIKPHILIIAASFTLLLFAAMAWQITVKNTSDVTMNPNSMESTSSINSSQINDQVDIENRTAELLATHCTICHSNTPTYAGFNAPPAGLVFETTAQLKKAKDKTIAAIESNYMPLANLTNMSTEERTLFLKFLKDK